MKSIFINKDSNLRSGWKISIVFVLVFSLLYAISSVINLGIQITLANKGQAYVMDVINRLTANGWFAAINGIVSNLCFIIPCIIVWKVFEKSKLTHMGLLNIKYGYKDFLVGLVLGAISMTVVAIILVLFGQVQLTNKLTQPNISFSMFTGLILFISVGFGEEILGRGYIISVLKQIKNKWTILVVSALIFSLLHGGNPNVTLLALTNIFFVGMLFGYMYLKLDNIWMPIGYHIMWNYFQGYVFGFQVSGTDANGIYGINIIKDNLLNGGSFGPEGGLAVTLIIIIGFFMVRTYYRIKVKQKNNSNEVIK